MRTCIYTASFGRHDEPPEIWDAGVDCICFTDSPTLERKTWRVIRPNRSPRHAKLANPRMQAKEFKLRASRYLSEYDASVWIDAAFWVHHAKGFAEHCLSFMRNGWAFYPHPADTRTLEQEVEFAEAMPKYRGEPLRAQVEHYRRSGFLGNQLLCGGVIAREHDAPLTATVEQAWLQECQQWTAQDQLSLPYVLWQLGVPVGHIPQDIYSNPFLCHLWSGTER